MDRVAPEKQIRIAFHYSFLRIQKKTLTEGFIMTKRKQIFNNYWITPNGDVYNSKNELLKIQTYKNGYKYVNIKGHNRLIHRLVAMAFLPDYSEDKQVHHINENKSDNRVENLKVMDIVEHQRQHKQIYSFTKICEICGKEFTPNETKRKQAHVCSNECKIKLDKINAEKRQVAIKQYSKNGDFIKTWKSARACQNETGYFESNINKCCNGKIKSYKGYVWKYA